MKIALLGVLLCAGISSTAWAQECPRSCRADETRDGNGCCIPRPESCRRSNCESGEMIVNGCCTRTDPSVLCRRSCRADEDRRRADGCCIPRAESCRRTNCEAGEVLTNGCCTRTDLQCRRTCVADEDRRPADGCCIPRVHRRPTCTTLRNLSRRAEAEFERLEASCESSREKRLAASRKVNQFRDRLRRECPHEPNLRLLHVAVQPRASCPNDTPGR